MNNGVDLNNVMMIWGELNDKIQLSKKRTMQPCGKLKWYQRWAEEKPWRSPPWRYF